MWPCLVRILHKNCTPRLTMDFSIEFLTVFRSRDCSHWIGFQNPCYTGYLCVRSSDAVFYGHNGCVCFVPLVVTAYRVESTERFSCPGSLHHDLRPRVPSNKSGTCLHASGVFLASNVDKEIGKTILQSIRSKHFGILIIWRSPLGRTRFPGNEPKTKTHTHTRF